MNYKIKFNIPGEPYGTEVLVTERQMLALEPFLNRKEIIKINNGYYNTTYLAKITPDVEANVLEQGMPLLEKTTQTGKDQKNKEALDRLKERLKNKFSWKE